MSLELCNAIDIARQVEPYVIGFGLLSYALAWFSPMFCKEQLFHVVDQTNGRIGSIKLDIALLNDPPRLKTKKKVTRIITHSVQLGIMTVTRLGPLHAFLMTNKKLNHLGLYKNRVRM